MENFGLVNVDCAVSKIGWASNDSVKTRRKYERRACDKCIASVNQQPFVVDNWGMGGVLLRGDQRVFSDGEEVKIVMKFKLNDKIVDIEHIGRIIRKNKDRMVVKFLPLSERIINIFYNVIKHYSDNYSHAG